MIKAIFFDLDGTLLNSKKIITSKTRQTLEQCKKNGIKLFIATARHPLLDRMLLWDDSTLSLFEGGVFYNGGCIEIGNYKEYQFISDIILQKVISLVFKYDKLNISLQLEDEIHAFRYPLSDTGYKSWGVTFEESLELGHTGNLRTIKLLVFYADLIDSIIPIPEELIVSLKALCENKSQFYLTDGGKVVQIMGDSVNKLKSIEKIRSYLDLKEDEIAVFGDDVNDIEMLSAYTYSFAMGNAENHVKEKANYVTLDNNSDGIHHAITDILQLV